MAKKGEAQDKKKSMLSVPLFQSLWEEPGRRALLLLSVFLFLCIVVSLLLNLYHRPVQVAGSFSNLGETRNHFERVFLPVGFLMTILSFIFFSLSGTYGEYTEARVGNKRLHPRTFFRKLSFYFVLLGAAFLLSTGVTESMVGSA